MSRRFKCPGARVLVSPLGAAHDRAPEGAGSPEPTMTPFSALSLLRQGLAGQRGWKPQWRKPEPKSYYDAIIVGGGGHGLGTAYYLAREHRLTNIAVLEKGWIGGGNTGRNTTIIRSNYLFAESAALYDHALKLWEGLGYYRRARTSRPPPGKSWRITGANCRTNGMKSLKSRGSGPTAPGPSFPSPFKNPIPWWMETSSVSFPGFSCSRATSKPGRAIKRFGN